MIRRNNQSHINKTNSVEILKQALEEKELKPDQVRMNKEIKQHIDYFEIHKIEELKGFIKTLHDCDYLRWDQVKIIEEFEKHMKNTANVEINLMKNRELKKVNSDKRNILMNRIAHQYSDEFISFLKGNLTIIFPKKNKTDELIEDFQVKIKELRSIDYQESVEEWFDTLLSHPEENDSFEFCDQVLDEDESNNFTQFYM